MNMGLILDLIGRKTLIGVALGFIIGLLIGWMLLGWVIFPVEWTDAAPYDLAPWYKEVYLSLVADSYALTGNIDLVKVRLEGWPPEELDEVLSRLQEQAIGDEKQRITDLRVRLAQEGVITPALPSTPQPTTAGKGGLSRGILLACGGLLIVVLLIAGVGVGVRLWQQRQEVEEAAPMVRPAPPGMKPLVEEGAPPPLGHFITSYALGNDSYDESFSIELPSGAFLGECGVGTSETIGMGPPDKVTAFEVWLFDKNDIRTVTKVLMSEYAFYDEELRAKLAPKGEAILAKVGEPIVLETASLRVDARITEMEYGEGNLPPKSFFNRLTVELVARQKETPQEATLEG